MSKRSRLKRPNGGILIVTDREAGAMPQNNYMKKIAMMQEAGQLGKPGALEEVTIMHDEECPIFSGGFCSCNPDITVKPL